MNRYIRSQVILNTHNKKFHQILQLTNESIIFASKSDTEKWLILNHRNSPDIYYAIKNNNTSMVELYFNYCEGYPKFIYNKKKWTEIIKNFETQFYRWNSNNIFHYLLNPIFISIYFSNLPILKKFVIYFNQLKDFIILHRYSVDFAVYMNHTHIVKYLINIKNFKNIEYVEHSSYEKLFKMIIKNNNLKMFKIFYKRHKETYLNTDSFVYEKNPDQIKSFFDDKKYGYKRMFKYYQEKIG